jgi:hypothetical protein
MSKQVPVFVEQAHHCTHDAQVPPPAPTRGDPPQQGHRVRPFGQQQLNRQTHHYQHGQGKQKEAHAMLAEIYNWFTEGLDTKDLQEAKVLLEELT